MEAPKFSEAVKATDIKVTEMDCHATCEQCSTTQSLKQAITRADEAERVYRCNKCSDVLAIVRRPTDTPIKNRGYRLNEWVVSPVVEIRMTKGGRTFRLAAKENAILPHDRPLA